MTISTDDLSAGARNLLLGCAEARAGETLLIVEENPALGFYGYGLGDAITAEALALGLAVERRGVDFTPEVGPLPAELAEAMQEADHTLFLARLGDQLRYQEMPEGTRPIVCYALDTAMLASPLGTAPYGVFVQIKGLLHRLFATARDIRVTCPLGTEVAGRVRPTAEAVDTSVRRFPMTVFPPLDAVGFAGDVAVAHFLVGTGSNYYEPYGVELATTLTATISDGMLMGLSGNAEDVGRAEAQYRHVGDLFGIDAAAVHSWHAGIHPGCAYPMPAAANWERWSGGAFGNPRLLHFHTCGAYAPGEICWNVVDPTVVVDGVALWEAGRLMIERVPGAQALLDRHPAVAALFADPAQAIGIG